jgi:glycosyltransferase involved in cell wall biosynthesis
MTADQRIRLLLRNVNGGVGAATVDGYRAAIADGATVIVKIDSDGQMNPGLIANLAAPILTGAADYAKGNRFFALDALRGMPLVRLLGNAGLSFLTKLSTGYWNLFDPTNGYTAIHADVAAVLPLERLHRRYFFESDLLFRLNVVRARVVELPMASRYGAEMSHLNEFRCLLTFPGLHARNFLKRIFYNYFLRNFSMASVNLVLGAALMTFGVVFGLEQWLIAARNHLPATAGTVMLSALPFLLGTQLALNFLSHDMSATPRGPIHRDIARMQVLPAADAGSAADASGREAADVEVANAASRAIASGKHA